MKVSMENLVTFAKQSGFVYQGSEIYGGLANTWDYGPIGVELKNNLKKAWWKKFIQESPNNVGLDSAILLNPKVWVASGHVGGFNDPLMDCKHCKTRHRADKLISNATNGEVDADGWTKEEMYNYIMEHKITCPVCGSLNYTEIREFNLMFKTYQGVVEDSKSIVYLRPETCQGIFLNFKNVQRTSRKKVPFGIGQIGKSFRNEITPGNFIFRVREFEQMELEFFCKPGTEIEWFNYFKEECKKFLMGLNIDADDLKFYDHPKEKLSHYSNATTDILYNFPWGFDELWGIASRTNFDLNAHQTASSENLEYLDPETNEKYLPYVVEPSLGCDRLFLAILNSAYEETERGVVLHLHPYLAPYKACILPLIKKNHSEKAMEVFNLLSKHFMVTYDEAGKIGKRYYRQDSIGTPFAITIDDDSLANNTVTIRDRDTQKQDIVQISDLVNYLAEKLSY